MHRKLLYISQATTLFDHVESFIEQARTFNAQHNITGYLLSFKGHFMQLLEGAPEAIDQVMQRIDNDQRHQNIRVLIDEEATQRLFSDWSMAAGDAKQVAEMPPETQQLINDLIAIQQQTPQQTKTVCGILLSEFKHSLE